MDAWRRRRNPLHRQLPFIAIVSYGLFNLGIVVHKVFNFKTYPSEQKSLLEVSPPPSAAMADSAPANPQPPLSFSPHPHRRSILPNTPRGDFNIGHPAGEGGPQGKGGVRRRVTRSGRLAIVEEGSAPRTRFVTAAGWIQTNQPTRTRALARVTVLL